MYKIVLSLLFAAVVTLLAVDCGTPKNESPALPLLDKAAFGKTVDGKQTSLYTLTNADGATLQFTNYGARLLALWIPDRDGVMRDVLGGDDTIEGAMAGSSNSGPVVGRYGNRIAGGKFTLDGVEYQLNRNNGPNQLHGGPKGWSVLVWDAGEVFIDAAGNEALKMTLVSPDGDENYPGTVSVEVTYTLTAQNELVIDFRATTDAPTVLNPTSHGYFNLHGTVTKDILSHVVTLNADAFLPTDAGMIPTGEIRPVEGTPMDFRTPTPVGERIDADYEPLAFGGGYDHNWVLNKTAPGEVSLAAEVYEPSTGILMKVFTDQPGIQFYTGNSLSGRGDGKYGEVPYRRTGLALEAQHYPDSPNRPEFPSTVLRPGETYIQHTVYAFSTQ